MATLSGNKIKDTYQSLVKFSDNGNITTSAKQLTDGFGNNSPVWVSTTQVGIGVTPESGLNLHVYGDAKIGSNLTVIGNLVVEGSTTTVGTDTLTVKDPLIVLANNNTSTDAVDIGFYGKYTPSGTTLYSGLFREALTGKYRLFKDLQVEPTTTVNTSGTGYTVATLIANLEGNVTGNLSGNVTGGTISGTTGTFSGNVDIDGTLDVDDVISVEGSGFGRIEVGGASGGYLDLKAPNSDDYDFRLITSTGGAELYSIDTLKFYTGSGTDLAITIDTSQDVTFEGNIILSGTVDGRDVSTDGNKLDAIEAGADVTDTANVRSAGALMDDELTNISAVKAINQQLTTTSNVQFTSVTSDLTGDVTGNADTATKIASITNSNIVQLTDTQTLTNKTIDADNNTISDLEVDNLKAGVLDTDLTSVSASDDTLASAKAIKTYVDSQVGANNELSEVLANGNTTGGTDISVSSGDDITFADSSKSIYGAGNDLEIYHDGTDSFIKESGTGSLKIWCKDFEVYNAGGTETLINADVNAGVQLYFDNSQKFATTSSGATVTGIVKSSGNSASFTFEDRVNSGNNWEWFSAYNKAGLYKNHNTAETVMTIDSSGNVGIGTTSPAVQLHISSSSSTFAQVRVEAGADGYDSSVAYSQAGTIKGISGYDDSTDTVAIKYGTFGGNGIDIDSSGNVGIGTDSPSNKLEVNGNIAVKTTGGNSGIKIITASDAEGFLIFGDADDNSMGGMAYNNSTNTLSIDCNNAERMTINSSGNVGIGTTSPSAKLTIQGTNSTNGGIKIQNSGGNPYAIYSDNNDLLFTNGNGSTTALTIAYSGNATFAGDISIPVAKSLYFGGGNHTYIREDIDDRLRFFVGGAEFMRFTEDTADTIDFYTDATFTGNVGIGTSSPSALLEISGIRENQIRLTSYDTTAAVDETIGGIEFYSSDTGNEGVKASISAIAANTEGSAYMTFSTGTNTERMRIDSSGNVGIGIAPVSGARLTLGTGSVANEILSFASSTGGNAEFRNTSSTGTFTFTNANGSSEKMRIDSSGNVGIGLSSPSSYFSPDLVVKAKADLGGITIRSNATTNNNYLMFADGTTGNERYRGYVNYSHFADSMTFGTAAGARMTIDSSGNAGIGTTSPVSTHRVTIEADSSNGTSQLYLKRDSTDQGLYIDAGAGSAIYNSHEGTNTIYGRHIWESTKGTDTVERMRIDSSGNVGIGTSSPNGFGSDTVLAVYNAATPRIKLQNSTTGTANTDGAEFNMSGLDLIVENREAGNIRIFNNGSERMRISGGGNVGINTTSPARKLDVRTDDGVLIKGASGTSDGKLSFLPASGGRQYDFKNDGASFVIRDASAGTDRMYFNNNGGIGIGITNPSYDLHVVTTIGTRILKLGHGASYARISTDDASKPLDLQINSQNALRVATSKNIGIGTDTPENKLHILRSSSDTQSQIMVQNGGSGDAAIKFNVSGQSYVVGIDQDDSSKFKIASSSALGTNDRVTLLSSGNVGIGTTSPSAKLQVVSGDEQLTNFGGSVTDRLAYSRIGSYASTSGTITGAAALELVGKANASGHGRHVWIGAEGTSNTNFLTKLKFKIRGETDNGYAWAGSSEAPTIMTLQGDGNVGIGTDSPNGNVQIHENSGGSSVIRFTNDTTGEDGSVGLIVGISTEEEPVLYGYSNKDMRIATNNTDRMRIKANGDIKIEEALGINVDPDNSSTGAALKTQAVGNSHRAAYFLGASYTDVVQIDFTSFATGLKIKNTLNALSSNNILFQNTNGTVGSITTSGSATAYNTSSDYRLKENVVEMTGSLDRVSQLKPSRFNFISDADKTVDGFLAHEVQDVVPEAITGEKDAVDEEGNAIYQGIDQAKLVPLLVGAIQELKAEIEQLKTQINN